MNPSSQPSQMVQLRKPVSPKWEECKDEDETTAIPMSCLSILQIRAETIQLPVYLAPKPLDEQDWDDDDWDDANWESWGGWKNSFWRTTNACSLRKESHMKNQYLLANGFLDSSSWHFNNSGFWTQSGIPWSTFIDHPATSQFSVIEDVIEDVKPNIKLTFFDLPTEIRLQIYDWLLVSRASNHHYPWGRLVEDSNQIMINIDHRQSWKIDRRLCWKPVNTPIHPAILRVCKTIYKEAIPILYSKNTFSFAYPTSMLEFQGRIGTTNLNLINSLHIQLCMEDSDPSTWINLFKVLQKAKGLRFIDLILEKFNPGNWRPNIFDRYWHDEDRQWGVVRAVGNIQGLEKLRISGYYPKCWSVYLQERMSGEVEVIDGWRFPFQSEDLDFYCDGDELEDKNFKRDFIAGEKKGFELWNVSREG